MSEAAHRTGMAQLLRLVNALSCGQFDEHLFLV